MFKPLARSVFVGLVTLSVATPLLAQARTAVSDAELDAAVTARPAGTRQAVQAFLATDQAKSVAGQLGVDASELSARVATVDQASLTQLAQGTAIGDQILAGGANTVVISTTALIIILLVIIILVR